MIIELKKEDGKFLNKEDQFCNHLEELTTLVRASWRRENATFMSDAIFLFFDLLIKKIDTIMEKSQTDLEAMDLTAKLFDSLSAILYILEAGDEKNLEENKNEIR